MTPAIEEKKTKALIEFFNLEFSDLNTILVGDFNEPFYKTWVNQEPAEIQFREDFLRSSLHEIAHWLVAGKKRLQIDDWGYWYEPDGRTANQQKLFYKVEIKPQAVEKYLCEKLDVPFFISLDNLEGTAGTQEDVDLFKENVDQELKHMKANDSFPPRTTRVLSVFKKTLSAID